MEVYFVLQKERAFTGRYGGIGYSLLSYPLLLVFINNLLLVTLHIMAVLIEVKLVYYLFVIQHPRTVVMTIDTLFTPSYNLHSSLFSYIFSTLFTNIKLELESLLAFEPLWS